MSSARRKSHGMSQAPWVRQQKRLRLPAASRLSNCMRLITSKPKDWSKAESTCCWWKPARTLGTSKRRPCYSAALRDDWRRGAVHHFGDHRADGHNAGGPDGGGDVGFAAPCASAGLRNELRDWAGVHDRPHSNAEPTDARVCLVLPKCGLAG